MILQSLYEYYERKSKLRDIAPVGFEWKQIPFLIVLDKEGNLRGLKDTREINEKKLIAKSFLIPQSVVRSGSASWKKANLLWDHYGYVLGYPKGDAIKDRKKRQELLGKIANEDGYLNDVYISEKLLNQTNSDDLAKLIGKAELIDSQEAKLFIRNARELLKALLDGQKQFETFYNSIKNLPENIANENGIKAIQAFYDKGEYKKVFELENWMDCANISGANLTFQIEGEKQPVLSNKAVFEFQKKQTILPENPEEKTSICLITGNYDYIERIHTSTPLRGGQATGKLVGFQKNSGFDSYGKEQAFNAQVGKYAQIAYSTALNTLAKSELNRIYLVDTTILFWTEHENALEKSISLFFQKPKDNPDQGVEAVKQLYEGIYSGKLTIETKKHFYVLGLVPNAARISVRFWLTGTVAEFAINIKQHFDDLEIVN
jgi:CRISPR-associated protein Csd1